MFAERTESETGIVNEATRCDISLHEAEIRWPGRGFKSSSKSARTGGSGWHGGCAREYDERRDFLPETALQHRARTVHDTSETRVR